jgi:hypothetical protein
MKHLTPLFLLALTVAACTKEAPPTTPDNPPDNGGDTGDVGNSGGGDDPSQNDPYACEVAEDCVAVELECCDQCNGGKAVAVHKDHVDHVTADSPRGRGECANIACTKMACAPWETTCDGGTCGLKQGSW